MHFKFVALLLISTIASQAILSGDEPYIQLRKKSAAESALGAITGAMHKKLAKSIGYGEISKTAVAGESGHFDLLNKVLKRCFLKEEGSVFSYQVTGERKKAIQFHEMELLGPNPQPITAADKLNGIEQRVSYVPRFKAYRYHEADTGWGEWKPSISGFVPGICLERRNGQWLIKYSPESRYSVK